LGCSAISGSLAPPGARRISKTSLLSCRDGWRYEIELDPATVELVSKESDEDD
jgi:hypothetical protein